MKELKYIIEQQNLNDLNNLRKELYYGTLNDYRNILDKFRNVRFFHVIGYEMDFQTRNNIENKLDFYNIEIDNNINSELLQRNIRASHHFLNFLNEDLKLSMEKLYEITLSCTDYRKLDKGQKNFLKDSYVKARYMHLLCTTQLYKNFLNKSIDYLSDIKWEMKLWIFGPCSLIVYLYM